MATVTYAEGVAQALRDALDRDPRVVVFGNFFGGITEHQRHFNELGKDYPERVLVPPWSEMGNTGLGTGAASVGMRPIVDLVTGSFVFQGFPQVVNEAANIEYMGGGQTKVPVVFHMLTGIREAGAAQHSHTPQAMMWNSPGLRISLPASPADAYGLLMHALLESEQPTAYFSHPVLFDEVEEIARWDAGANRPGEARVVREGTDLTIVASSIMVRRAREAAAELAGRSVSCEVIDMRTLVPFDLATIQSSLAKTGRLLVADECHRSAGVAGEVIARVVESSYDSLRAAPRRVTAPDVPVPFSPPLEHAVIPKAEQIIETALEVVG
jgi:pyruvate dehydrogenase E1 component beta subunit